MITYLLLFLLIGLISLLLRLIRSYKGYKKYTHVRSTDGYHLAKSIRERRGK